MFTISLKSERKYSQVCSSPFESQRRGLSIAQGVSPGKDKTKVKNSLSLWERARVREALQGRNASNILTNTLEIPFRGWL